MTSYQTPLPRRFVLAAAALTMAGCGSRQGGEAPVDTDRAKNAETVGARPAVVTMLGDSITAGYGLSAADALPAQLERAINGLGVPVRVRAAGVSGDTTAGGLARVDFSVEDDTVLCIVALGGNDLLQGVEPAVTRRNLDAIIKRLQARDIPVLLAGMRAPPQYGAYAGDFDRVFAELARRDSVAAYPFLLEGVALDRRLNQPDGIHPNPAGVKIIAAAMAPVVVKALREPNA